jgi:CRISPR system Cascade subunit CasB
MSDASHRHWGQLAGIAREWWREMQPDGDRKGDRAALARLRRAPTAVEALVDPKAVELCRRLGVTANSRFPSAGRVAALAAVLAHVREEAAGDRARRPRMMELVGPLGTKDDALSGAKLKEIRFRALLGVREDDELLISMRRLVALAGEIANIKDLARAMLNWSEATRTRWTFDYYGAATAAPGNELIAPPAATENAP